MTSFGSDRVPLLAAAGPAGRRFGGRLVSLAAALVLSLAVVLVVVLPLNMTPTRRNVMWRAPAGSSRDRFALPGEWLDGGGIGYTSSGVRKSFVRVVIRTRESDVLRLQALIHSLRRQAGDWLKVDFVLVPTQPGQQATYRALKQQLEGGYQDIMLLELPDDFFTQAQAENPFKCSSEERAAYLAERGANGTARLCDEDHYSFVKATDKALHDFVTTCRYCTHVLVTTGNAWYAPEFLATTAKHGRTDVVIAGFTRGGREVVPQIALGSVDLGATVFRPRVLEGGKRLLLDSLPEGAGAREVHDADYWFVKQVVESGCSHKLEGERILMYYSKDEEKTV